MAIHSRKVSTEIATNIAKVIIRVDNQTSSDRKLQISTHPIQIQLMRMR